VRRPLRLALIAGVAALAVGGAGVTAALMDLPQDAVPAQDPPQDPPSEPAPAGDPAPEQPVPVTPPGGADAIASAVQAVQDAVTPDEEAEAEAEEEEAEEEEVAAAPAPEPEGPPGLRQRRRYAIVQAVDKVTAETMRFEVEVNGRPVAFNKTLIFRARACEVSASDEIARDAVAYLEISAQPRTGGQETRQLFRGWMFASSPGLSGLQHPVYDAWVVGCRA
jgi:hypothetical protein